MGRKRKPGACLAPVAARKRRQPEQASGGWASLPADLVELVTGHLLDADIADYIVFRAVCSAWRDCTPTPGERDPRHRPRGWIALCDGDAIRPEEAGEIALFHTRTARRLRVRLPKLRGYRTVCLSDGLLVLLHKRRFVVSVLNPLTRVAVDFPSLASVYHDHETAKSIHSFRNMNAAVCMTPSSMAVVVWFPYTTQVVVAAEAGSDHWEILHRNFHVDNTLLFQERLYAAVAPSFDILQLYPPRRPSLVARVPNISRHRGLYDMHLAELGGRMMIVLRHDIFRAMSEKTAYPEPETNWWEEVGFTMYQVELNNNGSSQKLTPVSCLGDRALFLSENVCISVSARDLPSLSGNSIYFFAGLHAVVHSLTTGLSEDLGAQCMIHDGFGRIRPSVRPFTIADHLLTFGHPHEWTKGLMFHEYYFIPKSFKELRKKIRAKECQLRAPPLSPINTKEQPERQPREP